MNKALLSTGKNDWETPQDFFEELNNEFRFTLDPCASDQNHKCKKSSSTGKSAQLRNARKQ